MWVKCKKPVEEKPENYSGNPCCAPPEANWNGKLNEKR
ncbi:unnamed protein product, partial [marine sediment metagenome]